MPLLVSDNEGFSDDESTYSGTSSKPKHLPLPLAASIPTPASRLATASPQLPVSRGSTPVIPSVAADQVRRSMKSTAITIVKTDGLSPQQFKQERSQLMTIIVKYIATKIQNSFPPESPRIVNADELPLDRFLLLLTSRLKLSLPVFMKGIIYLFRYMDIIYLLRYLNQSNNFANYTDMGFELKKLIVGCFKLAIMREKKMQAHAQSGAVDNYLDLNWQRVAGLPNQEINTIVKKIVSRMNGKLNIKNIELVKLKSEIFRFVKMVATEV
ncbi:uncharacterized protein CANTADRAFT_49907 [Suhomyces tanzawaensis NRRL Y-17324]|uniref:Uncharacterized protein n=1 Tax=Suhomyces tanzawaensis NRRL Y-17324 TaxID=984487 RepID=A0A1E4SK45_9ASCO|nr:uncharacterized protein CANTADRAFT_49907 [Suhomyces tanzawaensis NRRL Y-17324]ODV79807.1 hypothetical protein CANTADRAFT_49907 [Suhomyces tanzawaensis NRRL Y-17324]